jgi:hypothetical protein
MELFVAGKYLLSYFIYLFRGEISQELFDEIVNCQGVKIKMGSSDEDLLSNEVTSLHENVKDKIIDILELEVFRLSLFILYR